MQAKNETFARMGLIASFVNIAQNEGIKGLWRVSNHIVVCHFVILYKYVRLSEVGAYGSCTW